MSIQDLLIVLLYNTWCFTLHRNENRFFFRWRETIRSIARRDESPHSGCLRCGQPLTLLEPQSRCGDKPFNFQVLCTQNGTAVLKGSSTPDADAVLPREGQGEPEKENPEGNEIRPWCTLPRMTNTPYVFRMR